MKKITFISCMLAMCLAFSLALAQDKVVVIPLGKTTTKVAGTDMQVQYNDNGTQAGANVYYDKSNGFVGIGDATPRANLNVYGSTDASVLIESPSSENSPSEIMLYTQSSGENRIEMMGNNSNSIQMYTANDTQTVKPYIYGGRARGTTETPAAVQGGDHLFGIFASGWGETESSILTASAGIAFFATEPFTDTTKGTGMAFFTTRNGEAAKVKNMHIHHNGNVGIGTSAPPNSTLQVEGYVQLLTTSQDGNTPPLAADCDEATELGRMIIDDVNKLLYICVGTVGVDIGWVGK